MVISFSYSFFEIVVLEPSISSPPPTVRVPEDFPELPVSSDLFSFLLNRLPNERGGDTIHLYPNHNKTVTVEGYPASFYYAVVQIQETAIRDYRLARAGKPNCPNEV
jgi:hypothetical protein